MAREIQIGSQGFAYIREHGDFYVDKTAFISDWWKGRDIVTLICRPRRFGKTLNLDTVRCFLSMEFAGRGQELFGGLDVWEDSSMRALQGTVPVVALSLAGVKEGSLEEAKSAIKRRIRVAVREHACLNDSEALDADDRTFLGRISDDMDDVTATDALNQLCAMLEKHYGVRPAVLLDEYDTPMQEAWLGGYWEGMSRFMRSLFNATFKTNPAMARGLITGITRVAQESIFSDLNNLAVITTTTPQYQTAFGFTQDEVMAALEEFDAAKLMPDVRKWYDGFTFGGVSGIYNPWSITCFLQWRELKPYWMNTSSNSLVSSLVRRGDEELKADFECLLRGECVTKRLGETVAFHELDGNADAVWALLLATGYLRVASLGGSYDVLTLELTNHEVREGFDRMVRAWFSAGSHAYNEFARALLAGDVRSMGRYLSEVAAVCMSSFDSATHPSATAQPERFWHGLVLGLLVELRGRYAVESNRESGYGRCDVMLVPNDGTAGSDPAIVLEFKVLDKEYDGEDDLRDTVASALAQIEERGYAASLVERGIAPERIRRYGIAFRGKNVLVG